ncbi:MAG: hypothetical protein ABH954_03750 [Candidatus Omnitrophota bacterium]
MLKRSQLLISDWQMEYIKKSAEYFDLSISEITRILISEAILSITFSLYPKQKGLITKAKLTKIKKRFGKISIPIEERHRIISQLYFEARKAVERNRIFNKARKKRGS